MTKLSRRAALALPLLAAPGIARAQSWRPSGQVRIIYPSRPALLLTLWLY